MKVNTRRLYTAKKGGVVVRRGDFADEALLREDFPAPEYELVLDHHLDFPAPVVTYADMRRAAYPSLSEFADAVYWEQKGDKSKMKAYIDACDKVKKDFPKPNMD